MKLRMLLLMITSSMLFAGESGDWVLSLGGHIQSDSSGNLVAVNLRGSWVNDLELTNLLRLPYLEKLDLSHTRISDEGMLLLKTAPKISDLNLYYAELITDQGMAAIKDWKHLKRLNVRGTRVSDGTLEVVSHLTQLEALDIANTPVTDNGFDYLITLTRLKELSLGRRRLSDNVLEMLRLLPTLTHLDLSGPRSADRPDLVLGSRMGEPGTVDENAVRAISELKDLNVLKLGYSNISADGLRILSALSQVEKLGLEACTRIDDGVVTELANWKSLKYVDLQETQVTEKGVEALRTLKPGLKILAGPFVAGKVSQRLQGHQEGNLEQ
jgi:Leucine-rich repeat (LRR) protein